LDNKAIIGTADYLAPEQAVNSHDVDIRADIYSLGGTFFFLLTGHSRFEHGTHTEKLLAHQMKDPTPVSSMRADIPKELEAIIKKMMAKKPMQRFQTPIAVAEALAPWTNKPVEPPAEEEMPRICTALEGYITGPSSGPLSGSSHPSSNRLSVPKSNPFSSSYLLRNGVPSASKWLLKANKNKVFAASGIGTLVLVVGLMYVLWPTSDQPNRTVAGGGPKNPPSQVPVTPPTPTKTNPAPNSGALSPVEAAKKVGDRVTVEFLVKNTGEARDRSRVFLNSADFREKDNFTVVLDMKKLSDELKSANIDDPQRHFKGKIIRASGMVSTFRDAPQLVIDDLKQVEIVHH
jgi:serine/threonine protein kinase